ncbi:MAG TPA: acetyltransferase [Burkholderiales bacterium]|nr:acetyltransferase [Burkholderiales bacterium]
MIKALIGYGGHAKEVMRQMNIILPCFVSDNYLTNETIPLSKFNPAKYIVMIAVSNSIDRYNIVNQLPKETKYFTWIHNTALIMDNNIEIGDGSFIGAYSILTTNIKLGNHTILNRANHIGHDCTIGNYFTALPGSIVSGNVKIGDKVSLGTNSSIKEKITICDNVVIGLNSGVVKNILEPGIYGGVPVKLLKNAYIQ